MALKRKLPKATYDKLSDEIKSLYVEKDGDYALDLDGGGDDDTGELKRAKDREAQLRREAEKRAKELQEQLDELSGNDAKKRGDIETLEKSWKDKAEKEKLAYDAKLDKLKNSVNKTLVDGTAQSLAAKISTVPSLMAKSLRERLSVDFDGDEPTLRILDAAGKPSALTVDDLEKEIVANKEFASIIIASKASGSGTSKDNQQKGHGSALLDADGKPKSVREMTTLETVAHIKATKEQKEG